MLSKHFMTTTVRLLGLYPENYELHARTESYFHICQTLCRMLVPTSTIIIPYFLQKSFAELTVVLSLLTDVFFSYMKFKRK